MAQAERYRRKCMIIYGLNQRIMYEKGAVLMLISGTPDVLKTLKSQIFPRPPAVFVEPITQSSFTKTVAAKNPEKNPLSLECCIMAW